MAVSSQTRWTRAPCPASARPAHSCAAAWPPPMMTMSVVMESFVRSAVTVALASRPPERQRQRDEDPHHRRRPRRPVLRLPDEARRPRARHPRLRARPRSARPTAGAWCSPTWRWPSCATWRPSSTQSMTRNQEVFDEMAVVHQGAARHARAQHLPPHGAHRPAEGAARALPRGRRRDRVRAPASTTSRPSPTADLIVAADGANSAIRSALQGALRARRSTSGRTCWPGTAPRGCSIRCR